MILYGAPLSPFVQRVVLAARVKGVTLAVTPPPGGVGSAAFGAISPMRRIPVLDEDGLTICESMTIVAHLDETLPGPSLLPDDRAGRARARAITSIVEGEIVAGLRPFIAQKAFRRLDDPAALVVARAQLDRGLDAVEQLADGAGPWIGGSTLSIADVALAPMLIVAETVERVADLPSFVGERPKLRGWAERAFADPLVVPTAETIRTGFPAAVAAARQQQAQQQQ